MQFNESKPIYLQLVDFFLDQIINGTYKPGDRVPSVRTLAAQAQVTPNTVNRAYQILYDKGIIYQKRGLGYFLAENAPDMARQIKREQFISDILPLVFKEMKVLNISVQELSELFNQYLKNSKKTEQ